LNAGKALIYSVIAMTGCFAVIAVQGRYARKADSPLLDLDVKSWKISAVISSAVAVAFVIAVILERTRYSHLVPYIDPLMVIILVLMSIKLPISALKEGILDLLLAAPRADMQKEIKQRISRAIDEYPVEDVDIRMVKVGRHIFVTAVLVLTADAPIQTVGNLDMIREEAALALEGVHPHIVLDILFTGNKMLLTQ
jgi:predicted Co/Zn/Cd cation transporter (cation efflux family)